MNRNVKILYSYPFSASAPLAEKGFFLFLEVFFEDQFHHIPFFEDFRKIFRIFLYIGGDSHADLIWAPEMNLLTN